MAGRVVVLGFIAMLCMMASWMLGYSQRGSGESFRLLYDMGLVSDTSEQADIDEALNEARDEDRDRFCNEIRRYKLSIAKDLDENTQICGYDDMDRPGRSN